MGLKHQIGRAMAPAFRIPAIRRICERAIAPAFEVPGFREYAARHLAGSLPPIELAQLDNPRLFLDRGQLTSSTATLERGVIAGVSLLRHSTEEHFVRDSPILREALDQIRDELAGETYEEIKNILRLLRPYAVKGLKKVRLGSPYDGGYVILDDFRGIDTAFSFGIEKNATWDLDVAKKGITVYQFDHTVDAPVTDNARLVFARRRISTEPGPESESLPSLIEQYDTHNSRPNILLKIDIDNDEWAVFDKIPPEKLQRFSQIAGEFHYFEGLSDIRCRRLFRSVLKKLTDSYAVIHIHANNCAGVSKFGNLVFPNVMEITFANRSLYSFVETDESYPGPLDAPNDPNRPELCLDGFRF